MPLALATLFFLVERNKDLSSTGGRPTKRQPRRWPYFAKVPKAVCRFAHAEPSAQARNPAGRPCFGVQDTPGPLHTLSSQSIKPANAKSLHPHNSLSLLRRLLGGGVLRFLHSLKKNQTFWHPADLSGLQPAAVPGW